MNKRNSIAGSIVGLVALLCVVTFLIIGFSTEIWHPTWMVFLLIPVTSLIVDLAVKRDLHGRVTGVVSLLCVLAYLVMGFLGEQLVGHALWHPGWIIFFAIPISGILVKMFAPGTSEEKGQDADTQSKS
jgi:hypothetical protein